MHSPLERDIRTWLADWNENTRPFVWTKTADEILDEVAAYCRRFSDSDHNVPVPDPHKFMIMKPVE